MLATLLAASTALAADPQVWRGRLHAHGRSNGVRLHVDVGPVGTQTVARGTYRCVPGTLPCLGVRGTVRGTFNSQGFFGGVTTSRVVCGLSSPRALPDATVLRGTYDCQRLGIPQDTIARGTFRVHLVRIGRVP